MTGPIECKNCKATFHGSYCPDCGQPFIAKFTWRFVAGSIVDSLEFNKGLLFNLKQFTLRPGFAIVRYLEGATKPYMNPVAYCLVGISLLFISIQFLNTAPDEALYRSAERLTYLFVVVFPFLFSCILYAARLGHPRSFLEGLIVSLFFTGHNLILLIMIKVVLFLAGQIIPVDVTAGIGLFLVMSIFFSVKFTQGFLRSGVIKTGFRLFIASLAVLTLVVVMAALVFSRLGEERSRDAGDLLGRVVVVVFSF